MSRLASLTPSGTPSRSQAPRSPTCSPAPPSPRTPRGGGSFRVETTHHRMIKLVIGEFKSVFKTWDELVLLDGVKAGKGCIDAGTEMDNIIALEEGDERPSVLVHLEKLYDSRLGMEEVLSKLDKAITKMGMLLEQAEKIYFEAYRLQGWEFVLEEPLWLSWTLERFVDSLSPLLTAHNEHLVTLTQLSKIITSSETSFDDARLALERWRDFAIRGQRWEAVREWEELVNIELAGGEEEEEEEEEYASRKGKKKSKR